MTSSSHGDHQALQAEAAAGIVVVASADSGSFAQVMMDGRHVLYADEPVVAGGGDAGPNPYELLLMALGSCTSMTVRLYAMRKKWPLEQVIVRLQHERVHSADCANCKDPNSLLERIECRIEFVGPLDETERIRLLEIAEKCPVHRTLQSKLEVRTVLASS